MLITRYDWVIAMLGRKYRNPPIDEAMCQFTWVNPLTWDASIPGRMFARFKNRYPALPSQQQLIQANLIANAATNPPDLSLVPTERFVFLSDDGTDRLSVGTQSLGFHRTKPYNSFEENLLPRITEQLPEALETLGHEPGFSKVSIRYINRIVIDQPTVNVQDYFTHPDAASILPEGFQETLTGFFYRTALKRNEQPQELYVTFGSAFAPKDSVAFVLDIDISHEFEVPAQPKQAISQAISLKELENSIFESLITDKCRELFK
jgi:uncharacterized protein (TIGR04255 family)